MKKLLSLMLISAMLLGAVSCGESDPKDDDRDNEVEETDDNGNSDDNGENEDTTDGEQTTEEVTEAETQPEIPVETTEEERLWEIEDNNSPANATKIQIGLDYFGNLSADYNTEQDWYEFTLEKETKVYLTFRPGKQMYSDSYWDISIRTAEDPDTDHWQKYVGGNIGSSVSPTWLLPAGTYYLELESSSKHSDSTYSVKIDTRS